MSSDLRSDLPGAPPDSAPGTPPDGLHSDLYLDVTGFAHDTPGWMHSLAEYGTEGGPLILAALLAAACWRVRRAEPGVLARALLGGAAVAVAYGVSEAVKLVVREERPCRAVAGAPTPIAPCPEPGDWSFPSNHATIAAAAAVAVVLTWRATAWLALPLAVLTAFSRVFLGVHYPHDVVAGALLGAAAVLLVTRSAAGPATALTDRVRTRLGYTSPAS
ncbi:phosphatase PAP2 family protein [Streptomyces verrucosisporus]|uniref:phosphatase PAP2 family protein n=1 Tax=Streptomyces verrucosisporus TaxID=1695161 RepID=UPI0019D0CCFC|nr:phosphatase PAP2 family protein [Streptomyces verrucosisporus]MBN3933163.1 phosphatase PAP2 family protein [Streptomyces verrucosisporus]